MEDTMKKTIAFLLAVIMILSLTACGSQPESAPSSSSAEASASSTEPSESKDPVPTVNAPAFDTSWAANDFEKLIPQPPFDGWEGTVSGNKYKMKTAKANADEAVNSDGSWVYYDIWETYISTLTDCGFSMDGDVYSASGTDADGNTVELMCGDGHAWITIIRK